MNFPINLLLSTILVIDSATLTKLGDIRFTAVTDHHEKYLHKLYGAEWNKGNAQPSIWYLCELRVQQYPLSTFQIRFPHWWIQPSRIRKLDGPFVKT